MDRQTFINAVAPIAVKLRVEGSPIFPSVRIAQAMLETGVTLHPWNNLVGLKVGSGWRSPYWQGEVVVKGTWEVVDGRKVNDVQAAFRAYPTIEHGFRDQDVLFGFDRYSRVRTAKSPEYQAEMLRVCGYATDPDYSQKLKNIIAQNDLKSFDLEAIRVSAKKTPFNDVPAGYWAESQIAKAAKNGIVTGISATEFGLGKPITREQLVVILNRLGLLDVDPPKK